MRVYQEARLEGRGEGANFAALWNAPPTTIAQSEALELEPLEEMGEALLDFAAPEDLQMWLRRCLER